MENNDTNTCFIKYKAAFGEIAFKGKKRTTEEALELAYTDMSRRARGHNKIIKGNCINELKKIFMSERIPDFNCQKSFDKWHNESCCRIIDVMKMSGFEGTYGKAQKVINMAFKYLCCCEEAEKYEANIKYCHMPLDSFTLEWFKRYVKNIEWYQNEPKRLIIQKMTSWSALEYDAQNDAEDDPHGYYPKEGKRQYYSYRFYYENIRRHFEENKSEYNKKYGELRSPLEFEFIVWPEIQKELAAEELLSKLEEDLFIHKHLTLKEYLLNKDEIKRMSLDDKLISISESIEAVRKRH